MRKDFGKSEEPNLPTTLKMAAKTKRHSGITMFTILLTLFTLLVGITAGVTYSAFQSEATSNGTLDFYLPIYDITLDNADATTNGTSTIYEKYVIGIFKNKSGENCTNQITTSQNNITVPARAYTVGFNSNGGSACANQTATYTFKGYYTATTGGTQLLNASGYITNNFTSTYFSSNSTLHAQWTSASITLPTPTYTGYTFAGWYGEAGLTNKVGDGGDSYTPTESKMLYAKWTANALTFGNQTKTVTFSTADQTTSITGATNGTGTYTYQITAGNSNSYFSISGTTITVKANTPANTTGYALTVRATDSNSGATKDATITVVVNKKAATISFASATAVKTYGDANFTITVTNTGDGSVTYSSNTEGVATVGSSNGTVHIVGAGSARITATVTDGANYTYAQKTTYYDLTVNKAAGSVTAPTAKTGLTYNGSAQELVNAGSSTTGTIQYKLNSGSYSTSIPTATNAGNYTVYYKVVGDANHNDVAEASVAVTIGTRAITITGASASKAYDGTALTSNSSSLTSGTLGTGDTGTYTASGTITNVGTANNVPNVVIKKNTTDVTSNYNITKVNGTLTITAVTLTVTADNKTITYGDAVPSYTVTITGFVNGETTSALTTQPSASCTYARYGNKGTYDITASGGSATNYTFSYTKGTLTVNQKQVTITWPSTTTFTYNGSSKSVTATIGGLVNSDSVAFTYTNSGTKVTTATNAGSYTAEISGLSGTKASNYKLPTSGKTQAWSIGKATQTITLSATSGSVAYGTASTTFTASTNGDGTLSVSDNNATATVSISNGTVTIASLSSIAAGTTITVTVSCGEGTNYSAATNATYTLTITRATTAVLPTWKSGSLTYTGSSQSADNTSYWNNYNAKVSMGGTKSGTNATSYTATFTPTSNYAWSDGTYTAKNATWSIDQASLSTPVVSISTAGVVTWGAITHATSYSISMNQSDWSTATSGINYNSQITNATGSRTVYVRANGDSNYINSTGNATVTVYSVTLAKGTGIASTSGAGNYINGATVTLGATLSNGYSWFKWTQTSGGAQVSTTQAYSATISGNWSYTANAVAATYTITYNTDGGDAISAGSYTFSTSAQTKTLTTPTKTGYNFAGYTITTNTSGSNSSITSNTTLNIPASAYGNITVKATWTAKTYTITLDKNGGTANGSATATYNSGTLTGLAHATRAGYTLTGYYTATSGGTKVINADGTLVANVSGYTGAGGIWTKDSDVTLNAQWTVNTYTITFKKGNSSMGTQSFEYGETKNLSAHSGLSNKLSGNGWSFYGWSTGADSTREYQDSASFTYSATSNATLYAIYTRNITFRYYNGASATSVTTNTRTQSYYNTSITVAGVNSVSAYTLTTQSTYSWAPLGWTTDGNATSASVSQTNGASAASVTPAYNSSATTYYAVYNRTTTLSYNANGGTGTTSATVGTQVFVATGAIDNVTSGSYTITSESNFTRTHYTFKYWTYNTTVDDVGYDANDGLYWCNHWNLSPTATMYAQWQGDTYTITYKDGGNTAFSGTHESLYPTTHTYGTATTLLGATKEGYNFGGWFTASACTGSAVTSLGATSYTSGITLYAKWIAKTYSIFLDRNDGTADGSATATYNSNVLTSITHATYTGYHLEGYYKEPDCTTKIADASGNLQASTFYTDSSGKWVKDSEVALFAKWVGNSVTINIKKDGTSTAYSMSGNFYLSTNSSSNTQTKSVTISSNSTGSFSAVANNTYYIWAPTISGSTTYQYSGVSVTVSNNSPSAVNVVYYTLTRSQGSNSTLTTKQLNSGGTAITSNVLVLQNAKIYAAASNNSGYHGTALSVYKTGDTGTTVTVSSNIFTMPGYGTTVASSNATGNTVTINIKKDGTSTAYSMSGNFYLSTSDSTNSQTKSVTISSNSTGSFSTVANNTYYIWAPTISGSTTYQYSGVNVTVSNNSPSAVNIVYYTLTRSQGSNSTLTTKQLNSGGTAITSNVLVLQNAKIYATVSNNTGYHGTALDVYKTSASGTKVTVSSNLFTMPGYGTTVASSNATANTYSIVFKSGDTQLGTQSGFTYGSSKALTTYNSLSSHPMPADNVGWSFYGWSRNYDTTTREYTNGQSVSNLTTSNDVTVTLYAIYTRDVTFYYYNSASATSVTSSTRTNYCYNGSDSFRTCNYLNTFQLYTQSTYNWAPVGWTPYTEYSSYSTLIGSSPFEFFLGENGAPTMYAVYSRTATLSYNANTGSGTTNSSTGTQYYIAGDGADPLSITLASNGFSKSGHTFSKWAAGSTSGTQYNAGAAFTFPNTAWNSSTSYTMYATWTAIIYTITIGGLQNGDVAHYWDDNTVNITSSTYTELRSHIGSTDIYYYDDSDFNIINFTRSGYTYNGLYTASSGGSKVVNTDGTLVSNVSGYTNGSAQWTRASNTTLYAQWTAIIYTITIGGLQSGDVAHYEEGDTETITGSTYTVIRTNVGSTYLYHQAGDEFMIMNFTRYGYACNGLYTASSGGSKVVNSDGTFVSNVSGYTNGSAQWTRASNTTLYAQWTTVNITVNESGYIGSNVKYILWSYTHYTTYSAVTNNAFVIYGAGGTYSSNPSNQSLTNTINAISGATIYFYAIYQEFGGDGCDYYTATKNGSYWAQNVSSTGDNGGNYPSISYDVWSMTATSGNTIVFTNYVDTA